MSVIDKYPKSVNVNFRKLSKASLTKVLRYYNVTLPAKRAADATQNELAGMVASVFEVQMVLEADIVNKFADKYCHAAADAVSSNRKRPLPSNREQLDREPAAIGEQVAAKVSRSNEDGSWILGNVLEYDPKSQCYEVQDEDDVSRVMILGFSDVRRLEDASSSMRRGDSVLAVFPETTSFYRAVVAKNPKTNTRDGGVNNGDVVVKFDDDEDESGKNPARRVPARFVLRRSDVEDQNNDSSDEDE